jgi:hypothetical protein
MTKLLCLSFRYHFLNRIGIDRNIYGNVTTNTNTHDLIREQRNPTVEHLSVLVHRELDLAANVTVFFSTGADANESKFCDLEQIPLVLIETIKFYRRFDSAEEASIAQVVFHDLSQKAADSARDVRQTKAKCGIIETPDEDLGASVLHFPKQDVRSAFDWQEHYATALCKPANGAYRISAAKRCGYESFQPRAACSRIRNDRKENKRHRFRHRNQRIQG